MRITEESVFKKFLITVLAVSLALSACSDGESVSEPTTTARTAFISGVDQDSRVRMRTDGRQVVITIPDDARLDASTSAGETIGVMCATAETKQRGDLSWPAVGAEQTVALDPAGRPASYCLAETREGGDLACVAFDDSKDWCEARPKGNDPIDDLVVE